MTCVPTGPRSRGGSKESSPVSSHIHFLRGQVDDVETRPYSAAPVSSNAVVPDGNSVQAGRSLIPDLNALPHTLNKVVVDVPPTVISVGISVGRHGYGCDRVCQAGQECAPTTCERVLHDVEVVGLVLGVVDDANPEPSACKHGETAAGTNRSARVHRLDRPASEKLHATLIRLARVSPLDAASCCKQVKVAAPPRTL